MKKTIKSFLLLGLTGLLLTSCSSDDDSSNIDDNNNNNETEVRVSGFIDEDTQWTNDKIYILEGKVVVDNGATLTIDPGTIIKGEEGVQTQASALIVDTGAKINAVGTPEQPIVFTSVLDNIEIGETKGSNLTESDNGLWGGVIILGEAPSSFQGSAEQELIEGIPADSGYGLYGGNNPNDDSGHVEYISIRHGGAEIGEGNEINGLTLGGVGNGTTIQNIEVVANLDDGVEWFGGTVDVNNIIVWGSGDDAIDIDQAFSGVIDNVCVIQTNVSDHALEIDGPEGSAMGAYTLRNLTVFGDKSEGGANSGNREFAQFRDGAQGTNENFLLFDGLPSSDFTLADDADVASNYTNELLNFNNIEIVLPQDVNIEDLFVDSTGTTTFTEDAMGENGFVTAINSADEASVGADLSVFSWSFTAQESGKF
ncbi:MAG: hypothetical protein ACQESK_04210 [Bacteroidota bacterium]